MGRVLVVLMALGMYSPIAGTSPMPIPRSSFDRPDRGSVGGLISQQEAGFASSNELMDKMPAALRQVFASRKIERPSTRIPVGEDESVGAYWPESGRVAVWRGLPASPDSYMGDLGVAEHELLHAAANEMPQFHEDSANGYAHLHDLAMNEAPWYQMFSNEPHHMFTYLGAMALHDPSLLPTLLQGYFAPLLPPVTQQRGPR